MSKASKLASRSDKHVEELIEARTGDKTAPSLTIVAQSAGVLEEPKAPVLETHIQVAPPSVGEGWRSLSKPADRTGVFTKRLLVTVSESTAQRLHECDRTLAKADGHPISRTALLCAAIARVKKNPKRYENLTVEDRPVTVQSRIDQASFDAVQDIRYGGVKKRNVSALLAAAIDEIINE